jgi:hypothetical protein
MGEWRCGTMAVSATDSNTITSFDSIFNVRDGFHAVPDGLIGELAGDHGTNLRLDYASPGLRIHNGNSRLSSPVFVFLEGIGRPWQVSPTKASHPSKRRWA